MAYANNQCSFVSWHGSIEHIQHTSASVILKLLQYHTWPNTEMMECQSMAVLIQKVGQMSFRDEDYIVEHKRP